MYITKNYRYIYILPDHIPAKCYTDENFTIGIAGWGRKKPDLFFEPLRNHRYMSYTCGKFAPIDFAICSKRTLTNDNGYHPLV